ncbi:MAG TPA: hypothetical protein VGM32_19440, partial [Rhodopila sp.]
IRKATTMLTYVFTAIPVEKDAALVERSISGRLHCRSLFSSKLTLEFAGWSHFSRNSLPSICGITGPC